MIGAVGLALIGLAYLLYARRYPLDTLATPGPGIFPLAAGILLVAAASWDLVATWRRRDGAPSATWAPPREKTALGAIAVVLGFLAAIPVLGFFSSAFLLVVACARLMGLRAWTRSLALGAGVVAAGYVLFVLWLGVPLPSGALR